MIQFIVNLLHDIAVNDDPIATQFSIVMICITLLFVFAAGFLFVRKIKGFAFFNGG